MAEQKGSSFDFARNLFSLHRIEFLGPEEILRTFGTGFGLEHKDVLPITFTQEELEWARKHGQFLELCGPVSMAAMDEALEDHGNESLSKNGWYKGEGFYLVEGGGWHWRLTTFRAIPGTARQNYLEQTRAIAQYLIDKIYAGQELPVPYAEAISELDQREEELNELMESDQQKANMELTGLALNRLCRETPAQVLWSSIMFREIGNVCHLSDTHTWTNQCSGDGLIVRVGGFGPISVSIDSDNSRYLHSVLGTRFSRQALS